MIPTLIGFGLLFGRWWRLALVAAALGWPVVLVATGAMGPSVQLLGASALAAANAALGIAVHRTVLGIVRSAIARYRKFGPPRTWRPLRR